MSERTVIGGTSYESVGSSTSNLLLRCNGTARILWGNKLIDLIKNGKIASGNDLEFLFVISDESEFKKEGIYIILPKSENENTLIVIYTKGQKYNLVGTDLYISANVKLDITVEQKKQALENIGIYYNSFEEVKNAGIQNGIVYVYDTKKLYTIKDGIIEDFLAEIKNVTVEYDSTVVNGNDDSSSSEVVPDQAAPALYSRSTSSDIFFKGMIVMFSGTQEVPEGWAICDGQEHTYEGVIYKTPDLSSLNNDFLIYIIKL